MKQKVVIVGGVAGGAGTAARLRRLSEDTEIIMFERGEYISFANCGLPYYIGGIIKEREKLLVQTEEGMEKRFNIDIRVNSEVTKIFRDSKEVEVASGGEVYRESYDYLVLSPGAAPIVPPIPGIKRDHLRDIRRNLLDPIDTHVSGAVEREGLFSLRNMADVDKIKDYIQEHQPQKAVVVGGGYIGVEMAENLKHSGLNVVLVEAADQIISPLDHEMARLVEKKLIEEGIGLALQDKVVEFTGDEKINVVLESGRSIKVDMVILAIGVKPEIKLAQEAGLEIGKTGGIAVDDALKTSDPAIFALGDAAEVVNIVNGENTFLPLAGPANKQARIVADNISGRNSRYRGSQGTAILKVFEFTAAATGLNEKNLQKLNIPYLKSYTHSGSHAGYYPGATMMTVKILFAPDTGKLLGAQAVGVSGVDKRTDIFATAIRHGLTVFDLEELELSYAPPYSSAKDPVNMAGFVGANIIKGDMKTVYWEDVEQLKSEGAFVLDARTELEYENGYYPDAVNFPVDELRHKLDEIPRGKKILIYCKIGLRAYIAYRILAQAGFDVYNISGGYDLYQAQSYKSASLDLDEYMTKFEEKKSNEEMEIDSKAIIIDACGLQCPGPIMRVNQEVAKMAPGEVLELHASDPAFGTDIKSWCRRTGNTLIEVRKTDKDIVAYIKKGKAEEQGEDSAANQMVELPQGKSIIVFSGDLDKAIASFIIANGGAAMGRKVTMFFTFWGLNVLRKDAAVSVQKNFIEKMFGMMMPRGSKHLKLSRMSMGGLGGKMIRGIMKQKNVFSLEELIDQAKAQGIRLVACSMSMDLMGIKREELIDGIEIGGVAAYLEEAEESNVNLFI